MLKAKSGPEFSAKGFKAEDSPDSVGIQARAQFALEKKKQKAKNKTINFKVIPSFFVSTKTKTSI